MTGEDIIEILEESNISPEEFYEEGLSGNWYSDIDEDGLRTLRYKLGRAEIADEGVDDYFTRYRVWHFPEHGVYIKQEAEFESYEAVNHAEDFGKEVHPRQITKTIYD
jgi:hypothetical protein